ncbi:hypothetical protein GCM10011490_12110 [Pseudoclavibacter endophyticus]|nr:hypothetical protein GCM10011490_12110 [Pseudoclavibacter endophyticus]
MGEAPDAGRGNTDTRERILDVALEEFAARGVAGVRVQAIADRARVSVRMIYYYFGSKRGLHEAVSTHGVRGSDANLDGVTATDVAANPLAALFGRRRVDSDFLRLIQWEELETAGTGEPVVNEAYRAEHAEKRTELIRSAQAEGRLPADLDARMLSFALHALMRAPLAFPGLARTATGAEPQSAEFSARYEATLSHLSAALRSRTGADAEEPARGEGQTEGADAAREANA